MESAAPPNEVEVICFQAAAPAVGAPPGLKSENLHNSWQVIGRTQQPKPRRSVAETPPCFKGNVFSRRQKLKTPEATPLFSLNEHRSVSLSHSER